MVFYQQLALNFSGTEFVISTARPAGLGHPSVDLVEVHGHQSDTLCRGRNACGWLEYCISWEEETSTKRGNCHLLLEHRLLCDEFTVRAK